MLLCDIGNTSYHFFNGKTSYKVNVSRFNPKAIKEKVYFISVNAKSRKKLAKLKNWIDLEQFVERGTYYDTMGIDRISAIEATTHGVVLDAGSAITVDVVEDGTFRGGFIYPGVRQMEKAYKNISPALAYSFNFDVELDIMPKNSQDAISYGFLKTLYTEIYSYKLPIILTGGDAFEFKKIFKDATVDTELIFSGMKKIMIKAGLC